MQVFYVNIGGGEPTIRPRLLGAARVRHRAPGRGEVLHQRQSGSPRRGPASLAAHRLRRRADLARRRDRRGQRRTSAAPARTPPRSRRWRTWPRPGFAGLQALGRLHPPEHRASSTSSRPSPTATAPQLRLTRLRPSGRGARRLGRAAPHSPRQQRVLYDWLLAHGEDVLTGDSFFHLAAFGESLPGLNLCGAGRVVCLIDPVGDVYACPFAIHDEFLAGNVRDRRRLRRGLARLGAVRRAARAADGRRLRVMLPVLRHVPGGCMAAKFFTGLPLDGPDPECVQGYGETAAWPRRTGAVPAIAATPTTPRHVRRSPGRGRARRPPRLLPTESRRSGPRADGGRAIP